MTFEWPPEAFEMRPPKWRIPVVLMILLAAGCGRRTETLPSASKPAAEPGSALRVPVPPDEPALVPLPQPTIKAKVVKGRRDISDVHVERGGTWVNLTRFARPHHVYDFKASPDDRWMFVWHMDYSPRKVSVYDLRRMKRVAVFVPGGGGSLQWTAFDTIYHQFGGGTNTAIFAVYDIAGSRLWSGSATGAELSPCGRYVITFPSTGVETEPIAVHDARDGAVLASDLSGGITNVEDIQWITARSIRVRYETKDKDEHTVDLELPPAYAQTPSRK
jgi:hypothetical protein